VRDRGGPWADLPPCRQRGSRVHRRRFEVREAPRNAAPAREGAGHRSCMIYSAIVCPYLAPPGARRKFEVWLGPEAVPRGDPRGPSAAVVGYDDYSWDISDQRLDIFYGQPLSFSATPAARTCSRNCTPRSPGNRSRPRRTLRTCWTMTPRPSEPRGPCLKAAPLGLQLPAGRTRPGKAAARAPGRPAARTDAYAMTEHSGPRCRHARAATASTLEGAFMCTPVDTRYHKCHGH
jgi:hypothetical protein